MTLLHCKCEGFILDMGVLNRLKSFPIFQLGHGYAFLLNFFHVYIFVLPYTGQYGNIIICVLKFK